MEVDTGAEQQVAVQMGPTLTAVEVQKEIVPDIVGC